MQPRPHTGYTLSALAAVVWASTAPGLAYLMIQYATPGLTLALWRDLLLGWSAVAGFWRSALRSCVLAGAPSDILR